MSTVLMSFLCGGVYGAAEVPACQGGGATLAESCSEREADAHNLIKVSALSANTVRLEPLS